MKRELLLGIVLAGLAAVAYLHGPPLRPDEAADVSSPDLLRYSFRPILHANPPAPAVDSLTESEALERMSRLFGLQSDIIAAQAQQEHRRANRMLDKAVSQLDALVQYPGMADRPRFRALYQSLTAEYEATYGVPDTLELPRGEIYDIRRELFAAVNDADASVLLEDIETSRLRSTDTEVAMTINEKVKATMAKLLEHPHRHLYPWLRRSATYFPMIEHVLAEENVPDELKYLALVESGLNPHAHSRARAAGLWQFVASTGRHYGLTVNPWVDERLDPEKSTRAAARHLRDLYKMFGDWQLALAGYNCNPAVIRHAVRKARRQLDREPTFWDIYDDIPMETRNYVPTFIAAALIVSNPAAFDLRRVDPGPRYSFDYVPVKGALGLDTVAKLASVDLSSLQALNPELRRDRLPPSQEPYYIRLPYGTYRTFLQNYKALPPQQKSETIVHTVRAGETVGRIAQRYGVKWQAILRVNDMASGNIEVGEQLTIPSVSYRGNKELLASAGGEPMRVRYGARFTRPITSPELALADPKPADR
jgi:membrane-bound lytic murein transglycosylase D